MHTSFVAAAALLAGVASASPLAKRAVPATNNPDWEYLGCTTVQPDVTFNNLHDWYRDDVSNNIDDCLAYARALGKPYAATFGPFCEVADFANLPLQLSTSSLCNTPCPGNSEQACGQWTGAQQIYKVKGDGINFSTPATLKKQTQADWEYAGCWDDSYGGLFEWPFIQSYQHKNNLETCFTTAAASDRPLVLLDRELCYGDYELMAVGRQVDDGRCKVPCAGNRNEYCGTVNALPMYKRRPAPTVEPTDASWSYSGCYTASSNPAVYPYEFRSDEANSATSCMAYARSLGKPYAALYGTYCIATDKMSPNAVASTDDLSCKTRCPGAVGEACATVGETVLVYKNEALIPKHYSNAKWKYKGCYTGLSPSNRASGITVNTGGKCGGVINGQPKDQIYGAIKGTDCWGLRTLGKAVKVDDSECDTRCGGDSLQLCGNVANNRYEVYDRVL
ncbi:hypothetical protein JCM10207_005945 [Rhodosporidiobolus poonsookiae]